MTAFLAGFYRTTFALAGVFLVLIGVLVVAQIVGRWAGVLVPGADEFAGFCMAASLFLALPHTLVRGTHIRVELILNRLAPGARRALETCSGAVAAAISGYFAWYAIEMARFSFEFGDMSFGLLPVPLWIPQTGLAIGLVGLTVASLDLTLRALRGKATTGL